MSTGRAAGPGGMGTKEALLAVARGERPGDLLFKNARVVNTFTAEVEETDVVVFQGRVAGLGRGYAAREEVDLTGRYLLPGFIDGHVHIESSYLWAPQYARGVVPRGTLAVVSDLHEIGNVAGLDGLKAVLAACQPLPLDLFLMAPSCVPATELETSGARLGPEEIAQALAWEGVPGLGEVMNFPGVIGGHSDCLAKIDAARGRPIDGHAPGVSGRELNAYVAAGPRSDHESTRYEEGREKLRRGMHLMIREGTTEKNLEELLSLVTDATYPRCLLVVDDRSCRDLLEDGDMDAVVRKAIRLGLDPLRAVQLVTINPATYFRLEGYGAVAPGYRAHLIVAEDLRGLRAQEVYYAGRLVAREGAALFDAQGSIPEALTATFHVRPFSPEALRLPPRGPRFPVIQVVPGQIITEHAFEEVRVAGGQIVADVERDILKLAVVERHRGTGNIGLGLARGFGLQRGALASSFAHDSHNIVAVGADDTDLYAAIQRVAAMQGGLAVAAGGEVMASLPLPVAGLMSLEPLEAVAQGLRAVEAAAAALGCRLASPFAVLSFLALPVIPSLKLTDRGLVDAARGAFVEWS